MHNQPKTLACSCCSGGELTRREIMQSNEDAVPFVEKKVSKKAQKS